MGLWSKRKQAPSGGERGFAWSGRFGCGGPDCTETCKTGCLERERTANLYSVADALKFAATRLRREPTGFVAHHRLNTGEILSSPFFETLV